MPDVEVVSPDTPPNVPRKSTPEDDRRLALLLHLLSAAPGHRLTRGGLNKKLRSKATQAAGLTLLAAVPLLEECSREGYVRVDAAKLLVGYTLTEAGKAQLDRLRGLVPEALQKGSRGKVVPPASDQVRDHRITYLLLEVLKAPAQSLPASAASKHLDSYAREGLELNAATARHLWQELAAQGMLVGSGSGAQVRYNLTTAGRIRLANAEFPGSRKFTVSGQALMALLEAAREVGKQFAAPADEEGGPPRPAELGRAVMTAFGELLRERHAVGGLVPIHEVRAEVRTRFGAAAARHDVFDAVVLDLWRAKEVRVTPITDHAKATPAQLQDSIPGVGETLFYLEAVHAPATV